MFKPSRLALFAVLGFTIGLVILYLGARGTILSPPLQCLIGGAIPGGFFFYYRWADRNKTAGKSVSPAQLPVAAAPAQPGAGKKKKRKKRAN